MVIQSFSQIKGSGSYYLNASHFDSRLLFTDTNPLLHYAVIRYDYDDSRWKVIANGKLEGYNNNTTYDYRFDFENYIKIEHYKTLNLEKYNSRNDLQYQVLPKYLSKVSISLSLTDILSSNTDKITMQANGEYWLNSGVTPINLTATYKYDYTFYDKATDTLNPAPTVPLIYNESWIPVTVYSSTVPTTITTKDAAGTIIENINLLSTIEGVPTVYMFYVFNTYYTVNIGTTSVLKSFKPLSCKSNRLYYWNVDGALDVIYSDGNSHNVVTVNKDYVRIGNNKLPIKINIENQMKVNTGFKLSQEQIYGLIKSPFLFELYKVSPNENLLYEQKAGIFFKLEDGSALKTQTKRWLLDTNSFEGYVGSNYSERNIELLLSEEKISKRLTNIDLDFYD